MKILCLYCREFHYSLDHPTVVAELNIEKKEANHENALVVFITVEASDSEEKINSVAKEIRKLARKSEAQLIVLNPFSHLSIALAPAELAKHLLKLLFERLIATTDNEVLYTSFGWYKSFLIDVYGHDNSQVFRDF
jgi:threonyl-tRNA synthetase